MTTAHFVKKCRKTIRGTGIKKGDSYWWWKFRYGDKHVSKTQPRPSQLTGSEFLGTVYSIEEGLADVDVSDREEVASVIETAKEELAQLRDETDEKFNNMPDSLQQGDTGQLLEQRVQDVDTMIDELDNIDPTEEDLSNDDLRNELDAISYSGD